MYTSHQRYLKPIKGNNVRRLVLGLAGVLALLAGCSSFQESDLPQLEAQLVESCNFAGGPRVVPYGTVVAEGAADCKFVRDGRDSAQVNVYLQKRRADGTWQALAASLAEKWTLPSRVDVARHTFGPLSTVGACTTGVFRTQVVVRWPNDVSNPLTKVWYSVNRQLACTRGS